AHVHHCPLPVPGLQQALLKRTVTLPVVKNPPKDKDRAEGNRGLFLHLTFRVGGRLGEVTGTRDHERLRKSCRVLQIRRYTRAGDVEGFSFCRCRCCSRFSCSRRARPEAFSRSRSICPRERLPGRTGRRRPSHRLRLRRNRRPRQLRCHAWSRLRSRLLRRRHRFRSFPRLWRVAARSKPSWTNRTPPSTDTIWELSFPSTRS